MKTNQKQVKNALVFLLVAQSLNLAVFMGLSITQAKLANYVYSITSEPFLASNSQINPPSHKSPLASAFVESSVKIVKPHLK